jgi:DNA polymerase III epsilon subunit family exonuclease
MRYAVIDVETTGFSPIGDGVVEAACVIVHDRRIVRTWTSLVNPGRPIPDYATRVHGITDADVASAPHFERVQHALRAMCEGAIVVAHNAKFDLSFLPLLASLRTVCTLQLARRCFPNAPNHKNQTLRAYLQIDELLKAHAYPLPLTAHRALDDALVTAGILLCCLPAPLEGQEPRTVRKTA